MDELFDKLVNAFIEAKETADYENNRLTMFRNEERINEGWAKAQDALNDYIDKRIELANRS